DAREPRRNGRTSPAVVKGPRAIAPDRARNTMRVAGLPNRPCLFRRPHCTSPRKAQARGLSGGTVPVRCVRADQRGSPDESGARWLRPRSPLKWTGDHSPLIEIDWLIAPSQSPQGDLSCAGSQGFVAEPSAGAVVLCRVTGFRPTAPHVW